MTQTQNHKILYQGAEAVIIQEGEKIIKRRVSKSYRLAELDEKIRRLRTRSEAKLLEKASKIIPIPKVIKSDEKTKEIIMEFVPGKKLSEHLDSFSIDKQKEICRRIGQQTALLHDNDIIHGDLTTSNMILAENPSHIIYFIDFGLGFNSKKAEDKAVDLHLLKQALEAKHFLHWQVLFDSFLEGYKKSKNYAKTLERLKAVEKRGRYRH
jgi:Kae1-associated kinase Bud32